MPLATGNPATMYKPNGQQHIFYRGIDNGIYQVFYDPTTIPTLRQKTYGQRNRY
jgi:hypothetical protein